MNKTLNLVALKDSLVNLIKNVSKEVLKIYSASDIGLVYKEDKSPFTKADKLASDMICAKLKELTPDIPIICEETKKDPFKLRKKWKYVWSVDPIDGTKEFVKRTGEFTVNIGLIKNGKPFAGFVGIPTKNEVYYGIPGLGAFKDGKLIKVNEFTFDQDNINIVASKSHFNEDTKNFIKRHKNPNLLNSGSSIKFLLVAEGSADYYPRIAPTYEWDTCASHAILNLAGGKLLVYDKEMKDYELSYNKENLLNPHFVCIGKLKK